MSSPVDRATILPIQPEDVDYYWPFVSCFIESALEYTDLEISLTGIRSGIINRHRQLWVVKDEGRYIAAVVTMIYTTDTGIIIGEISIAGGKDHDKWSHFPDAIEPFLREQGCRFVDIVGRRGWVRKYRDAGFHEKYVIVRKELQDVRRRQGIEENHIDKQQHIVNISPVLPDE